MSRCTHHQSHPFAGSPLVTSLVKPVFTVSQVLLICSGRHDIGTLNTSNKHAPGYCSFSPYFLSGMLNDNGSAGEDHSLIELPSIKHSILSVLIGCDVFILHTWYMNIRVTMHTRRVYLCIVSLVLTVPSLTYSSSIWQFCLHTSLSFQVVWETTFFFHTAVLSAQFQNSIYVYISI